MFFLTHQEYARIEKEQRKIRENQLKIQNVKKTRLKREETKAIETLKKTLKSNVFVNDINFFDFTLQINILELRLSILNANFLQQLKNSTIKYKKKNIISLLNKCFRDSIYK